MPTIAGQVITRGEIRLFEQGDWFADIATQSDELLPVGTRVSIVVETMTFSGAIVRGGITEAVGRYQVAGRPEWGNALHGRAITGTAYRSASAVLLQTVLDDLVRDVLGTDGRSLVVMPPDATLDKHYERPGTSGDVLITGRDALELMGLPYYVRNDGITVFAARPTGNVTTDARILVEHRNDAIGYRVVNCEDPGAFAPGLTFEGETIGELVVSVMPEDIKLHVWTRAASSSFADALRTVWRRLFPRVELQGVFSYVVAGPSQNGRHDLRSTRSRHLPDVRMVDAWGAAGFTADLPVGTRVLVAFADGDPGSPVLVAVDPSAVPTTTSILATTTLSADAAAVNLGGALLPVVRYGDTVAIAGAGPAAGIISFTPAAPPLDVPSRVKA